jgi:hypothetical protein
MLDELFRKRLVNLLRENGLGLQEAELLATQILQLVKQVLAK